MARREPEAEHGRRHECGHQQLRSERGGAEGRRHKAPANLGHRLGEPLAVRAPQPPEPSEGQHKHRSPAQQPVLAVDEQRYEPVDALQISARKVGLGAALPGRVGGIGRGAAVERLVEGHVEGHGEQRELHRPHSQRPAPRPPQLARGEGADQHARGDELGSQPRQRAEQREAHERLHANDARAEVQGQQRCARERGPRGELGVDGAAVGHEWRAEPDRERGAERPRVWCRSQREPVSERHRESGDRGEKQLHALHAADPMGRREQQWEADAVRLVQAALRRASVAVEVVRIELGVCAGGVLVEHVHVAVLDDRLGGQQIVRLVAAVIRGAERVQPKRGRVGGEQQQPEGEGATHRRRTLARKAPGYVTIWSSGRAGARSRSRRTASGRRTRSSR